jgi:hypothetical protein
MAEAIAGARRDARQPLVVGIMGSGHIEYGDGVAAAKRRIDNDRRSNPNRGRAGLERAQLELSVIESQLRLRGLLE